MATLVVPQADSAVQIAVAATASFTPALRRLWVTDDLLQAVEDEFFISDSETHTGSGSSLPSARNGLRGRA